MTTITLSKLIGKAATATDERTGCSYTYTVFDAKNSFGNLRLLALDSTAPKWFEPTPDELNQLLAGS